MYDFIDTTRVPLFGKGVVISHGVRLRYETRFASVPALTEGLSELADALKTLRDEQTDPAAQGRLLDPCVQLLRLRNAVQDSSSLEQAAALIRQTAQALQRWTDLPLVDRVHQLLLGILRGTADS